jgi:hypothetical protein
LERLPPEQRPVRVRGDSAFGNEGIMAALEDLEQAYLFKLHQSAGVKRLIERQGSRYDRGTHLSLVEQVCPPGASEGQARSNHPSLCSSPTSPA